jgi:recombinational DNA repair protein RecR
VPIIIILNPKSVGFREVYFLIKEQVFPIEGIRLLKTRCENLLKFEENYTIDDIIAIAEETIEEFGGTCYPFTAFKLEI